MEVSQQRFRTIRQPNAARKRSYALAKEADAKTTPYLFLTCGEQEGLLTANRKLAGLLKERGVRYEFVTQMGHHNWEQWDKQVPGLFDHVLSQLEH